MVVMGNMGEEMPASAFPDISTIMEQNETSDYNEPSEQNDPIKLTIFTDKTTGYCLEYVHVHLTFLSY